MNTGAARAYAFGAASGLAFAENAFSPIRDEERISKLPDGFFKIAELPPPQSRLPLVPRCGLCRLYEGCHSPKMPIWGEGKRKIFILGECPGKSEDQENRPFIGKAGQKLRETLDKFGVDLDRDCWTTNSLICFISDRVSIYTSEGYKQIRYVQVGDLVLTHKGRFRKVLSRSQDLSKKARKNQGLLVDIRVKSAKLTVTADHLFLADDGEWLRADELRVGNRLRVFGEKCEACGTVYFKPLHGFETKMNACCMRCHNVIIGKKNGPAISRAMLKQYEMGTRDRFKTTESANKKMHEMLGRGEWNPAACRSEEGKKIGYTKTAKRRQAKNELSGNNSVMIGIGEKEIAEFLQEQKIEFYSQYAVGQKSFDFFLPDQNLLVEVENPVSFSTNVGWKLRRFKDREKIAINNKHKLVILRSKDPLRELQRILRNDRHEFHFTYEKIDYIKIRPQKKQMYLYCLEVEEDHSYVSRGLISHNCRPKNSDDSNRTPTDKEISWCRPNVMNAVKDLKPHVIIPLGGSAVKSLLGWLWRGDSGRKIGLISRWDGWAIPSQKLNAWICPTWHPSYIIRNDYGSQKENEVRELFFERHLKAACGLQGRPWKEIPDWRRKVRIVMDPTEAAEEIDALTKLGKPVAFDYETDGLKPDSKDLDIYCCSLSDGKTAFAFPWHGGAVKAMKRFLLSDTPKLGWNCKYESRFSYSKLGIWPNAWIWDGMIAAHILDNRPSISGLKFQSFVNLGMDSYDDYAKPFLKAEGSNLRNKIREADLGKILGYCALDSLLTHKISMMQMEQMGVKL